MSLSRITEDSLSSNAVTLAKITGIITPEKGGTGVSNVGTTGNVLTSNGTAWISKELLVPSNGFASVQVFSTVGNVTWTKPANLVRVKVTVVGGGGGGGISGASGGGAGAGGGAIKFIPAPSIPGPVTVTIGEGGLTASPPGAGSTSGNTSSFGAFCSATGGSAPSSTNGGFGGVGSDGDVNTRGGRGSPADNTSGNGSGGVSLLGGGGPAVGVNGSGGEGGPGRTRGGNGIVVVEEFF